MKAYLISHTHWDREWYQTFQDYRARLVNLLDELIGFMEKNPAFKYYHLDGQTIVLEDYLEVRPENRRRLQRLIKQGRLIPGPWYVMPDEFLVSGEALIRNLQLGSAISRAWGVEPMKVGYIVDIFGHNTQMPQICQGFGMESVVAFRGVSGLEASAEFIWEGADGSSVFFYRLPDETAYSNFWYKVRKPQLTGAPFDLNRGCADLKTLIEAERARSTTGVLLIMDGVDHVEVTPELPALLERMQAVMPQAQIVHGRLEDFHRENLKHRRRLPRHAGELRTPRMTPSIWPDAPCLNDLLANVLSSRIRLKQRNVRIQELLERQAEPWAVCAETAGRREIAQYFDIAWRHLLQNHPHDSICGCSIDQVHQDMLYRFDQAEQIGTRIASEAVAAIHAAVRPPAEGEYLVSVFNPSPFPRQGVVVELEFPNPCPDQFSLARRDGTPVPYQRLSAQPKMRIVRPYRDVPSGSSRTVQTVFADVTVPALGYTTLVYKPDSGGRQSLAAAAPKDWRPPCATAAAGGSPEPPALLENGLVRLAFDPDGTVTLTDLATGEVYPGLNAFADGGDTGDGYKYVPPATDRIVTGLSDVSVAVTASGPFVQSAVVRGILVVPAGLTDDKKARLSETVCLRISSTFTLRHGSRRVDVRTEIDNTARDHVIKALFPARAASCESFADSMFDVVRRDIRQPEGVVFHEPWQENRPLESFVGIGDRRRGLAVFAKGLHEGGVRDDAARTVFLTLLRCFGHTVLTLGEEGGQMLGRQTLEYAFMPACDGELPALLAEREQFLHPVLCSHSLDILLNRRPFTGTLEDTRSFLSISDPRVVLSALRRNPRGELILRVFNPTPDRVTADIEFGFPVSAVTQTDLAEDTVGKKIRLTRGRIRLMLAPKRIKTLTLERVQGGPRRSATGSAFKSVNSRD
jgi:alpha-mannosidase/mannosylglycerate hydrolase